MEYFLNGSWTVTLKDGSQSRMILPGTLDENGIGYADAGSGQVHPDEAIGNPKELAGRAGEELSDRTAIATRFTRKHTYEGEARLTRRIAYCPPEGKRVFLEAERARCLKLLVDGREVEDFVEPSVSTPHVFEVTGLLNGENELTLVSDNSYPGLPHDDILYSSAATDETQTNWNGVLGYFRLRTEEPVFLSALRVYPSGRSLTIQADVCADKPCCTEILLQSPVLKQEVRKEISLSEGSNTFQWKGLPIREEALCWDEYEGKLYELTAALSGQEGKKVAFGIRDFGDNGEGRLAINGRTIFLRSEANCAVFPEEGHPPMTVEEWLVILRRYQSYGVNCMRFHSHCPPEAAFYAADQIGMLMQPELSQWNPVNAFESEESLRYYTQELKGLLLMLANHPSFVMLSFGNELQAGALGHERMRLLLKLARSLDSTRLYAEGSNVHYGNIGCEAESDFYTTQRYLGSDLRGTFSGQSKEKPKMEGHINNQYPNAMTNYDKAMERIRQTYQKPVFSFETGQFEILPDFDELKDFQGISEPVNYRLIQKKADALGLLGVWKQYVEATGELARIGYREEIEAAMRTGQLSGISLLGLQDFPGQGTALVGMMNSHLQPKPFAFARPEAFQAFFRDQLPLVLLPKYTFETEETLKARLQVANFGKRELSGEVCYELRGEKLLLAGRLPAVTCPMGRLTEAGMLELPLHMISSPARLDLTVTIDGAANTYPVWVYPPVTPVCPADVYETRALDERAKEILKAGGKVYLSPRSDQKSLPQSIQAQFTTDFWSVGTFTMQEGGMGQLIDASHPLFSEFPTETHTNWQWWPMASQRAVILPGAYQAIVTEMDSYAFMRPMAQLFECRCGGGKLMFSSMGLSELLQYPEARALQAAIYKYMASEKFRPGQEMEPETIEGLVR